MIRHMEPYVIGASTYARGCRCAGCKADCAKKRRAIRAKDRPKPKVADLGWMDRAACRGEDINIFFVERGEDVRPALQICDGCPVQEECLDYALVHNIQVGVWGGLSARQRRRLR